MSSKLGKLLTEQRNPNSMNLDSASIREILEIINKEDQIIAAQVALQMDDIEKATTLVDQAFQWTSEIQVLMTRTSTTPFALTSVSPVT